MTDIPGATPPGAVAGLVFLGSRYTGSTAEGRLSGSGGTFSLAANGGPAHGTVTVLADGQFTYMPAVDFLGTDSFTFAVTDGLGVVSTAVVSVTVADSAPSTILGTAGGDVLTAVLPGPATAIYGFGGNDVLRGDVPGWNSEGLRLYGGEGNDDLAVTYFGTLFGGAGNDILSSSSDGGSLYGGDGDDQISWAKVMDGGAGNDTYFGTPNAGGIREGADGGNDTWIGSFITFAAPNVENFILAEGALYGYVLGNDLANRIVGGTTGDSLSGAGGDDLIRGEAGDDELYGGDGNDLLVGGAGPDTLDGGEGADRLKGGSGPDEYWVDSNDTIAEDVNGGYDRVTSRTSFALGANIELLQLGDTAEFGTGNDLDNRIYGGFGVEVSNTLSGLGGNDTLRGRDGDDLLTGGSGNDGLGGGNGDDVLRGGGGQDRLAGGAGDDSLFGGGGNDLLYGGKGINRLDGGGGDDFYEVISAKNQVAEAGGGGHDRVQSYVSLTLGSGIEDLFLLEDGWGHYGADGTGNALGNTIGGNRYDNLLRGLGGDDSLAGGEGQDTLDGGRGADRMDGGAGDDLFVVGEAGDTVVEGWNGGRDTVFAHVSFTLSDTVENLILADDAGTISATGSSRANYLEGNVSANTLRGGGGRDELNGWTGNDLLYGGTGADTFDFVGGRDRIADFVAGEDIAFDDALYGERALTEDQVLDYGRIVNGSAVFDFGNGNVLTISGLTSLEALKGHLYYF